eukprot:TRINITY_DN6301_c0_g1_i3.p1 TRINITY_DN6301_c0_g1~~TRINITY_DN6301_c0_g1_i3.p1  ORF type:complete len:237 (+),score=51.13 TRINITY_DN6301_c0_g1_i3:102-713(+)
MQSSSFTARPGMHRVQLAFTQLDISFVPGTSMLPASYHTSVLVDGVEYTFSNSGIQKGIHTQSHENLRNKQYATEILNVGVTNISASVMAKVLTPYFQPGSYDLLRKNCNSFSACAIFFLLGSQLDEKFQALERLVENHSTLVQVFTFGSYQPKGIEFDQKAVCACISQQRDLLARQESMQALDAPRFFSRHSFVQQRAVYVR